MGTVGGGTEMAQAERERRRQLNGKRKGSEFLTRHDVADLLGMSVWGLVRWRREHRGPPFVRIGRKTVRYPRRDFDKWLASLPRK